MLPPLDQYPLTRSQATRILDRSRVKRNGEVVWRLLPGVLSDELGLSVGTVERVAANRDHHDPVDDDVAIERALDGDPTVLAALTYFEVRVILRRLSAMIRRGEEIGWLLEAWGYPRNKLPHHTISRWGGRDEP